MSAQHTQGRLIARGGYSIYDANGTPVADTCLAASIPDNDEANARRLAACWNALVGIETETLEQLSQPLNAAGMLALQAQRDELLECLKLARAYMRTAIQSDTYRADPTCQRIESAIAKHQPAGEGPATPT